MERAATEMNFFLHKTPRIASSFFPDYRWRFDGAGRKIFLTFDDGPIPDVTEFVLEKLQEYNAKATFFCIGNNVVKNRPIFDKIVELGHAFGNHTYSHLRGWDVEADVYFKDFEKCQAVLPPTQLFRPPYGRITKGQAKLIRAENEIIMWDVLTGDYDADLNPERILKKTLQYTESGSIVLFHDSLKAQKNMCFVLPKFLDYFSEKGFTFEAIPQR